MIISTENLLPKLAPVTYLAGATPNGSGTLPVRALNLFNASWALQIGETGEAQTEVVLLGAAAPSGTIGTITATTQFAHPIDTPVYGIKYDQVVFERSTTGTAGTATPIASGTITIMANGTLTIFDDTSGSSSYAYKTYFRNSVLNQTSPESNWITFAGYPLYSLASIRTRIKDRLFNNNYISNDEVINNWVNEWLEVMTNTAIAINQDYVLGSTTVTFSGTADLGTISATDFKQARRIWMGNYEATVMDVNRIDPNTVYSDYTPVVYFLGDTVLGRANHTTSGTASILYYKMSSVLVDDTDQLPVMMQGYSKSFVDYGYAQALRKDNRSAEADSAEGAAFNQLNKFKAEITPRTQTLGFTYARIDEAVTDDYD